MVANISIRMIVLFIVRLSFCHVENQVRQPVSGFHWSIQISKRWKDQSAGKQRAVAGCAPASPRVSCRVVLRRVAWLSQRSHRFELSFQPRLARWWARHLSARWIPGLRKVRRGTYRTFLVEPSNEKAAGDATTNGI